MSITLVEDTINIVEEMIEEIKKDGTKLDDLSFIEGVIYCIEFVRQVSLLPNSEETFYQIVSLKKDASNLKKRLENN